MFSRRRPAAAGRRRRPARRCPGFRAPLRRCCAAASMASDQIGRQNQAGNTPGSGRRGRSTNLGRDRPRLRPDAVRGCMAPGRNMYCLERQKQRVSVFPFTRTSSAAPTVVTRAGHIDKRHAGLSPAWAAASVMSCADARNRLARGRRTRGRRSRRRNLTVAALSTRMMAGRMDDLAELDPTCAGGSRPIERSTSESPGTLGHAHHPGRPR